MKRLTVLLFVWFLCAAFPAALTAEEGSFPDAGELLKHWHTAGFPDYVCGVWSTDGGSENLTISLTDDEKGEAGKREILESVADDSTITLAYARFPRNELCEAQKVVTERFQAYGLDTEIFSAGLLEQENVVEVGLDLKNADEEMKRFIEECQYTFGDKIRFVQGSRIQATIGTDANFSIVYGWLAAAAALFLLIGGMLYMYRRRCGCVRRADGGTAVLTVPVFSRKQIEKMVKSNTVAPSPELDESVLSRISKP